MRSLCVAFAFFLFVFVASVAPSHATTGEASKEQQFRMKFSSFSSRVVNVPTKDAQPVSISNGTTLYLRFNSSSTQNITFDATSGAPSTPSFATIYASYGDQSDCYFTLYGPQTGAEGNDFFGAFSATFLGSSYDSPPIFTLVVDSKQASDPNLDAVMVSAFAAPIESLSLDVSSDQFTFEPPFVFVTQQLNLSSSGSGAVGIPAYLNVFLYNSQADGDESYEAPAPTLRIGFGQVFEDDCIDENRTMCVSTTNVFPTPASGLYFALDSSDALTASLYVSAGFSFYDDFSQIPTGYSGQLLATLQAPIQVNVTQQVQSDGWIVDSIPFRGIRSYALNFSSIVQAINLPFYAVITLQHRGAVLYVGSGYLPSETNSDDSMTQQNYIDVESIQPEPYPYLTNSTELVALSTLADLNELYYLLVNSFVYGNGWNDSSISYKLNVEVVRPWFIFLGSCNVEFLSGGTAKSYAIDLSSPGLAGTSITMHVESGNVNEAYAPMAYYRFGSLPNASSPSFYDDFEMILTNGSGILYITVVNPALPLGTNLPPLRPPVPVIFSIGTSSPTSVNTKVCSGVGRCTIIRELNSSSVSTGCECPSGFVGPTCELQCPRSSKDQSICSNAGTCTQSGPVARCACFDGHYGTSCETFCTRTKTCSGHGTCDVALDNLQPQCVCDPEWTGNFCDIQCPQGCDLSRGSCVVSNNNTAICQCFEGYRGPLCEHDYRWSRSAGAIVTIILFVVSLMINLYFIGMWYWDRRSSPENQSLIDSSP